MAAPSSLLVIDPGMTFAFGHHLAYSLALRDAAERGNMEIRFLAGADLNGKDGKEQKNGVSGKNEDGGEEKSLPLAGIIDWPFYAESEYADDAPPEAMLPPAGILAEKLHHTADALLRPGTLVLCHTLHPSALLGLLLWRAALPPPLRPRLAACLMLGLDGTEASLRRLALCAAHADPDDGDLKIFGGTKAAAALLSTFFRRECPMPPSPLPPEMLARARLHAPEPPVFALLGNFRGGKNLQLLPAAIMRYLKTGGQGRFIIRMPPIEKDMHAVYLALYEFSLSLPERLEIHFDFPDRAAYYAALGGSSALILPYAPENYHRFRPSGPAIEAAALGVPVISFAGGFIEDELAPLDNGSLFLDGGGAAALAEGLLLFEREVRQRKARAAGAAGAYAARHNADALLEVVCS